MICSVCFVLCVFVCQAEDGIRDLVRSRGLGDVYKRQPSAQRNAEGAAGACDEPPQDGWTSVV